MSDKIIPLPGVDPDILPRAHPPIRLEGPDGYVVLHRVHGGVVLYARTLTGDRMNLHIEQDKVRDMIKWLSAQISNI
jgi:hypothetical protein